MSKKSAFSLIEIMIALVIIGIITSIAYPRYQKMVLKSYQSEAKSILRAIFTSQDFYYTMHQEYATNLSLLDIDIPETARYMYEIVTDSSLKNFTATAKANLDDDDAIDEWQIDETNKLQNNVNDAFE